jgi:hypothetical protein
LGGIPAQKEGAGVKFLLPVGGVVNRRFGILTSPQHKAVPVGIKSGMAWAADNNAFTQGFDPDRYFPWLEAMRPYRETCLFVAVPDVVGNAIQTGANYRHWLRHFEGWTVAFVAQDGQEHLPLPDYFDALFIGGGTAWKESQGAIDCIRRAQARGAHVHIGRVNWGRRYRMFAALHGSKEFTCDGTRTRFEGTRKTVDAWSGYMAQRPLVTI